MSGKVKRPGLWELPMGTTIREILEEHAGGMRDGVKFRGVLPGGASTDFLIEEHLDVKMDFDEVQKVGSRLGTGTMIVLDDKTCPVGMCRNLEHFFAQESCGWCTPCWSGLSWVHRCWRRWRKGGAGLFGPAGVSNAVPRTREHVLRAGAWRGRAVAERVEIFSRRFRAAHPGKAVSVELADGTDNDLHRATCEVNADRNVLEVCLSLGLDLPYFCWHPAMGSVGA